MYLYPFAILPLPNWRVTFDGLSRIKFFQKYFTSVVLGHGYRSSFSVNTFLSNILYRADRNGNPLDTNQIGNFIPRYNIGQVTISEQFSPLGSIDITWKNNLLTRVEFKRDRTVSLAMSSNQVNEVRGQEYIVGVGYRIKEFKVPFKIRKKQVALKNDLDLKTDFIYRRSSTIIRKVVEGTNQPSSGTNIMIIKAYADYIVNERFNIRLFYERQITIPVVSISFPTSNTQAGISMRFTLTQ
jgi:cell surface protein SprA